MGVGLCSERLLDYWVMGEQVKIFLRLTIHHDTKMHGGQWLKAA